MSKLCDIDSILDFSEVQKVIDDLNHAEVALSNAKTLFVTLANSEVKEADSNSGETILETPAETTTTWVPLEVPFSERLVHAKQDVLEAEFLVKEAQDLVDVWGTAVRLIKSANAKIFDLVMKI
jgi:hypothetical protein